MKVLDTDEGTAVEEYWPADHDSPVRVITDITLTEEGLVEFSYEIPGHRNGSVILGVPLDRLKKLIRGAK